jgi:recombination protein RecT
MVRTLQGLMPHVPALLPPDISTEQFRAALYLELSGRAKLADCVQESLRDSVIYAASYGLLPGRDVHFLPFKSKRYGNREASTPVPNYFGIILTLERTGKVAKAFAHPVYTGDEFTVDYLADIYKHIPAVVLGKPKGHLRFFYGCIRLLNGTTHIEVMDETAIDAIRRRAPAHDAGPWVTDYEMMARKTCLKRVAKYVKLTPQLQEMLAEEDDREHDDIPLARHRQNIVDLFGEGAGGSQATQETTPPARQRGEDASPVPIQGEETQDAPTRQPGATTGPPAPRRDSIAWDTLRGHRDDARLPADILADIAATLEPDSGTTETQAQSLASMVLDWLNQTKEGQP